MVDFNALARLTSPASVGQSFASGLQLGQQQREKIEQDRALAQYAQAPSEQTANALLRYAPELAVKLGNVQRERSFGEAAGQYYRNALSGPQAASIGSAAPPISNALSGLFPSSQPTTRPTGNPSDGGALNMANSGGALGRMPPMPGAVSGFSGGTFDLDGRQVTPSGRPGDPMGGAGPVPDGQPASQPDFSVLGAPRSQADASFLEMLRIDPKRAMAIESDMRDRAADRLKLQKDAYGFAVSRLGSVTDEESYRAALNEIQQQIAPLGVDVASHLPPQWPGKEGLRELRLSALDAKDQLTYLLNEDDKEADNARADRNTDSLIGDRAARRGEISRNNARRDVTTRRGQDIRATTTQRGQDLRGSGGGRENIPTVKTPEEARKLAPGTKFKTPDGRIKVR